MHSDYELATIPSFHPPLLASNSPRFQTSNSLIEPTSPSNSFEAVLSFFLSPQVQFVLISLEWSAPETPDKLSLNPTISNGIETGGLETESAVPEWTLHAHGCDMKRFSDDFEAPSKGFHPNGLFFDDLFSGPAQRP